MSTFVHRVCKHFCRTFCSVLEWFELWNESQKIRLFFTTLHLVFFNFVVHFQYYLLIFPLKFIQKIVSKFYSYLGEKYVRFITFFEDWLTFRFVNIQRIFGIERARQNILENSPEEASKKGQNLHWLLVLVQKTILKKSDLSLIWIYYFISKSIKNVESSSCRNRFGNNLFLCWCISTWKSWNHCKWSSKFCIVLGLYYVNCIKNVHEHKFLSGPSN